jgi:hypothetical protein
MQTVTIRQVEYLHRALCLLEARPPEGTAAAREALADDPTPIPAICLEHPGTLPTWLLARGRALHRAHARALILALARIIGARAAKGGL